MIVDVDQACLHDKMGLSACRYSAHSSQKQVGKASRQQFRGYMLQVHKPASTDNNRADIIFLRDYEFGVLSNETVLRMADKDAHRKNIKKDR